MNPLDRHRHERRSAAVGVGPVFIGIPCGEWLYTRAIDAIWALQLPPGSASQLMPGGTMLVAKRNTLVQVFLGTHCDALLFLDSDMTPAPDVAQRLLSHGKGIVGAMYFGREPGAPYPHAGLDLPDGRQQPINPGQGLQVVDWVGTGALLIRREVLAPMTPPWFTLPADGAGSGRGEDLAFCRRARAAGHQVWCDTDYVVGHLSAPHAVGLADFQAQRAST